VASALLCAPRMNHIKHSLVACLMVFGFAACAESEPSDVLSTFASELDTQMPATPEAAGTAVDPCDIDPDGCGTIDLRAGCYVRCGSDGDDCRWECCVADGWQICCSNSSCDSL
jgi:hypothetical protein